MVNAVSALVVHDLKNELGALEGTLSRLVHTLEPQTAAAAHQQCCALRERLVMYLTLYGADGPMRALMDDESPVALLEAAVARRGPTGEVRLLVGMEAEAPPYWYLDRRLVALALDAALHNALRFARQQVTMYARGEGSQMVLVVADDGPGLDPNRTSTDFCTGLGTTLCQAVARAHGGHVALFNRPEGGARFELWLAA